MSWSLRELLVRWQAGQYQQTRRVCEIVATLYNVQRTQRSDPVYTYLDFHPLHATQLEQPDGRQKLQRVAAMMAPGMVWADTHRPEVI
jgi:hypothetical protein